MLLALDVGNTSITVGIFQGRRLRAQGRIPTHGASVKALSSYYRKTLAKFLRRRKIAPGAIEAVVVSSVVPAAVPSLIRAARAAGLPRPLVVGKDLKAPVINRYRVPSQVGQDRLVNAAGAFFLYGGPAIVVDFGTAITVDLVSKRREYLGGLIVPGIEIALEALTSRAALLPKIKLAPPTELPGRGCGYRKPHHYRLLGRDTVSSMKSGIFYGFGALCDGLVKQLRAAAHALDAKVIATGGYARLMAPYCRTLKIINPELTLQGLELTYRFKRG